MQHQQGRSEMPSKNLYISDEKYAELAYLSLKTRKEVSQLLNEAIEIGLETLKMKVEA